MIDKSHKKREYKTGEEREKARVKFWKKTYQKTDKIATVVNIEYLQYAKIQTHAQTAHITIAQFIRNAIEEKLKNAGVAPAVAEK